MAVKKIKLTARYFQTPNDLSDDTSIGYRALGIMSRLFRYSDGTNIKISNLVTAYDSAYDVGIALHQLCFAGYAILIKEQIGGGKMSSHYDFSQFPNEDWREKYLTRVKGDLSKLGLKKQRGKRATDINLKNRKGGKKSDNKATKGGERKVNKIDLAAYKKIYAEVFNFLFSSRFIFDKTHELAIEKIGEIVQQKHFKQFLLVSFIYVKKDHDKFMPSFILNQINSISKQYKVNFNKLKTYMDDVYLLPKYDRILFLDSQVLRLNDEKSLRKNFNEKYNIVLDMEQAYKILNVKLDANFIKIKEFAQMNKNLSLEEIKDKFL